MAKTRVRKGKVYKGGKPKKVKGSSSGKSLKAVMDKWGKKYDILK